MKRDHYIAQTYLKHFGDSNVGGRMHAYRKSGKSSFQPWPADVCADWNDDLNVAFLPHNPEMLGEYRAIFEPMWNPTIEKIASRSPTPEDKFAIAGYLANLMTCTPTWRRVGVEILNDHARGFLYFSKEMKDRYGGNANLPDEAIEMMKAGQIALEHDPDYVKAKVTRRLLDMAWIIFNQNWTVLTGAASQKFVTSDNPSAISYAGPGDLLTRYFPLTPDMCVEVAFTNPRPKQPVLGDSPPWKNESTPPVRYKPVAPAEIRRVNKLVIQNAEEMVFSSESSVAIEKLTHKLGQYRVTVEYVEYPDPDGKSVLQGSILRVSPSDAQRRR